MKISLLVIAAILVVAAAANAAVKPNSLFCDNAVLQRNMSVPVWGTADPGERISVSIQRQKVRATANADGKWMLRLEPLKAGGPFTMTIVGSNVIELKNILVGEVWVASGQSNMQWTLSNARKPDEAIAASGDPQLRLFTVPRVPSATPVASVDAKWEECGPQTAGSFSAVGYYFGRDLRKALGVPVGIISSNFGGTRVEAWTQLNTLLKYAPRLLADTKKPKYGTNPNGPAVLYNGMIVPILPYAVRGAIWYQGESNAGVAESYRTTFPGMIANWRKSWGEGNFPFLFVQLAPYGQIKDQPSGSNWAELREAQLYTTQTVPNTGMAVITDWGESDNIHPKDKEPVGGRLALAARVLAYGEKIVYMGPEYKSVAFSGNRAVVTFDTNDGGLVNHNGELKGFTIAGTDGKFFNARASILGNRVIVSSPEVAKPAAVRYGWADCPIVNLFNDSGLPASPFRTDNFPMVTAGRVPE